MFSIYQCRFNCCWYLAFSARSRLDNTSRLFLQEIESCIAKGEDFSFETTLAGRSYLKLIKRLQADNWQIYLIYLALPSMEMSKMRVNERVIHGGHNIPVKDIERRFSRSLKNLFMEFSHIVNNCTCFMNEKKRPIIVFEQEKAIRNIIHDEYFQLLEKEAKL